LTYLFPVVLLVVHLFLVVLYHPVVLFLLLVGLFQEDCFKITNKNKRCK